MALGRHNLARLAEESFERHGDHPVLFFEGRWYGSGDLTERTRRLAAGFAELGVAPGDRVAVTMANAPEVPLCYQALWRAGAVVTPAIFLLPPQELRHILEDSEARAIVTTPEFLPNVMAAAEGLPELKWILSLGPEHEGVIPLSSLEEAGPGEIVPREDGDLAGLLYTGGTTGRAKGVMLSHENMWWCGRGAYRAAHVPGVNRTIGALPLAHGYGLVATVAGLHGEERGDAVLMRWFEPRPWLELVQEHRVQRALVVPAMIQLLLGEPLEEFDLSSLRFVNCGAAPLAPEVARAFERRVPSARIHEGYGLTESGAMACVNPPDERKLGSVGRPYPGYEVAIMDEEGGRLAPGEVGEVCIRSRGVMLGYWREPELTAETIRDGWLLTGDLGTLDEDGYLFIVDRKKDLIIRGGFNVYPRDVEDALLEHPAVEMAGVIGLPDPVRGEEVVAFVSVRPGSEVGAEELIEFSKERLSAYKYPREVRIVPAIPLTPIGKVDRKALREMA